MIKSITQIQHLQRFASQHLRMPDVGIIGGYHGGNLGDIALGESVRQLLLKRMFVVVCRLSIIWRSGPKQNLLL